jgi:hypothetical protein
MNQEIENILKRLERLEAKETPTVKPVDLSKYLIATDWIAYTPTVTGWSDKPYVQAKYLYLSNLLVINCFVQGTSNSTTTRITLPPGLKVITGVQQFTGPIRAMNNGTYLTNGGMWIASPSSTYINCYINYNLQSFAASGSKQVQFVAVMGAYGDIIS